MAAVQPVNSKSFAVAATATFSFAPAQLDGNGHYLVHAGSFRVNGVKQYIDMSFANVWRDLASPEAVAAKIMLPVTYGWDIPVEDSQLLNAGTAYQLDVILGQPGNLAAITNVYLELMIYP